MSSSKELQQVYSVLKNAIFFDEVVLTDNYGLQCYLRDEGLYLNLSLTDWDDSNFVVMMHFSTTIYDIMTKNKKLDVQFILNHLKNSLKIDFILLNLNFCTYIFSFRVSFINKNERLQKFVGEKSLLNSLDGLILV